MITVNGQDMQSALIGSDLTASVEMADAPYSNSEHQEPYDSKGSQRRLALQGRFKGTVGEITAFIDFLDGLVNVGTVIGDGAQSKRAAHQLATGADDLPASRTYNVLVERAHWSIEVDDNKRYAAYSLSMIERPAAALE